MSWWGIIIAAGLCAIWFVPKVVLEVLCFKDKMGACRTLLFWLVNLGSLGLALLFSLLIDYFR